MTEYEFEVWQDDEMVASVRAADRLSALKEIAHYATVYAQDGPCEVVEVTRTPINWATELKTAVWARDVAAAAERADLP